MRNKKRLAKKKNKMSKTIWVWAFLFAFVIGAWTILFIASAQVQVGSGNQGGVVLPMSVDTRTNLTHGEMWIYNESLTVIDIVTQNVYVNVTPFYEGNTLNVDFSSDNHTFIIKETGTYFMDYSVSFGSAVAVAGEYGFTVFINDEAENQTHSQRDTSSTTIGNTGTSAILDLEAGDLVYLKVRDESFPIQDIQIHNAQFQILKLDIINQEDLDDLYVSVDGDTMFGDLVITGDNELWLTETGGDIIGRFGTSDGNLALEPFGVEPQQLVTVGEPTIPIKDYGFNFTGTNEGNLIWMEDEDYFYIIPSMVISNNLTVAGNISAGGLYFGNGSQLSEVCKSDGSDCMSTGSDRFNENINTTINGTWHFDKPPMMLEGINITQGNNLSFSGRTLTSCLDWYSSASSSRPRICNTGGGILNIVATNVNFPSSQKLNVGSATTTAPTGYCSNTVGIDDCIQIDDNVATGHESWSISYPLAWDNFDAVYSGLIFNNLNGLPVMTSNNFTWLGSGCLGGDCDASINSVGSFVFRNQDSVNTTNDFCIQGGVCLNDTGRKVFSAYDGTGSQDSPTGTPSAWVNINYTVEKRKDWTYSHSASDSNITVLIDGDYLINYDVCLSNGGGLNRASGQSRALINGAELVGSYGYTYNRGASGSNSSCASMSMVETLSANDNITIQFRKLGGVATTNDVMSQKGGTRIFIDRL